MSNIIGCYIIHISTVNHQWKSFTQPICTGRSISNTSHSWWFSGHKADRWPKKRSSLYNKYNGFGTNMSDYWQPETGHSFAHNITSHLQDGGT